MVFMVADASWEGRGSLVAPYFFEVEEMVGDGQYGGGYAPCGRAGSGGGWVVGLLLVGISWGV